MHFRDRGRSIQLVRTTYNNETKKPSTEVVGRLSRPKLELSDEIKAKLTPEEAAEVEEFRARVGRRENIDLEYAVSQFPAAIGKVSEWLKVAEADAVAAFVEEIQKPLTKLRRQMAKAGASAESAEK